MNKKLVVVLTLVFTFVVLAVIYFRRLEGAFASSLPWWSPFFIYGFIVTPFLMFKFAIAYRYKPVPDVGHRPSVSVIIPVLNEVDVIERTVNALLNSDYPEDRLEIIVVDDGSTDGTYHIVSELKKRVDYWRRDHETPDLKVLKLDRNYGKRFAFARGVRECRGDVVICVDSDSVVENVAIRNLVQPFKDPSVYCTCGHGEVLNKNDNTLTHLQRVWYADGFRLQKGMESYFGMVTCCSGLLAAYRRDGIQSVIDDWLNEKFMGRQVIDSDDRRLTNLMLRLRTFMRDSQAEDRTLTSHAMKTAPHTKSLYQSNAVAYTVVPRDFKKFSKQQLRWGRGSFRGMLFAASFFWKRPPRQALMFYLLVFVNYLSPLIMFVNVVVFPLLGQYWLMLFYFGGLFLIHFIYAINSSRLVKNISRTDIAYRTTFVLLSLLISTIYIYGWVTAWKGKKWMTR